MLKLSRLQSLVNQFDWVANTEKIKLISNLSDTNFLKTKKLEEYLKTLLFLLAYPSGIDEMKWVEKEIARITKLLKNATHSHKIKYTNSGLTYTHSVSCFSHDFVRWLLVQKDFRINIDRIENTKFDLNEVLKITLPSIEVSETTAGCDNEQLFDALLIKKADQLQFLINELARLDNHPLIKDHFFEGLGIYVNLKPVSKYFSTAYNRFNVREPYFHDGIMRDFNFSDLLNKKIPQLTKLSKNNKEDLLRVIKYTMALTDRETDPVTYMDETTLRFYEIERGISIAIYGMEASRQLPLESYVGYTLFKNGIPAAYGGGWVFGNRSNFGINVFEAFRGGESGYILCQLLRVYRQVFKVDYFVIESYQYGYENPEGITSGAFWFYHRYGFRPIDKGIAQIAKREFNKIGKNKKYRTNKKTLLKFTESDMALKIKNTVHYGVHDITNKVKRMIQKKFSGNRLMAEQVCVEKLTKIFSDKLLTNEMELKVLIDVSLWAEAYQIKNKVKLKSLVEMAKTKPVDLYKYQDQVLQFFKS